jgi:hypothetical protein
MDQVIEHSVHPKDMLKCAATKLDDGGKIILATPNVNSFCKNVFRKKWIHWHCPYHINLFTKKSLELLANEVGLKITFHRTRTHSNWLYYQFAHLILSNEPGTKSRFWSSIPKSTQTKIKIIIPYTMHKIGITHLITRVIDFVGLGDSQIMILEKVNNSN